MKTINYSLLGLLLLCLLPVSSFAADDGLYHGINVLRGTVVSAGRVDPTENIGTGYFFDANYTSVAVNFGAAFKRFGGDEGLGTGGNNANSDVYHKKVTNVYAGIGFSRIIQLQYGYGNEKSIFRVRSDINARAIIDFLTKTRTPKQRMTLGDRLTFSFSVERYLNGDHDVFDNATWGIGLLF
jgi:hypothetical protein